MSRILHPDDAGWLPVKDDDDDVDLRWPWQPSLEGFGLSLTLPVWFATEDDCMDFIKKHVLGFGLHPSI